MTYQNKQQEPYWKTSEPICNKCGLPLKQHSWPYINCPTELPSKEEAGES